MLRPSHPVVLAALAAVAAAVPATAQAAPTLQFAHACYSAGDRFGVTGNGFTAGATVDFRLTGKGVAGFSEIADPAGTIATAPLLNDTIVDALLHDDELAARIAVTATDRSQSDPTQAVASGTTVFSRFGAFWDQNANAMRPLRPLRLAVGGFTGDAGRPLYLHYLRAGRRIAVVRLGILQGDCGIVFRTLRRAFPMTRVAAGAWTLAFSLSRTNARALPWLSYRVRVRR